MNSIVHLQRRAAPRHAAARVRVSVVIKALNEERHVEAAIVSALAAVAALGGEVILADSGSTDRTVEIARKFPIAVVQLKNHGERRCGVGPQLGFQHARGEFVYILDGDMELDPSFLATAVAVMEADPRLGGVGGLVEEVNDANYQFRGRKRRAAERIPGHCEWLDMGGLYRASALRQVHYFSNRNLHAFEEMDLGLRLGAAGWCLRRIATPAVKHYGREESNWALLVRRWRTHYLDGAGELLRGAVGTPYFLRVARAQVHLFVGLLVWLGLAAGLLLLPQDPAWLLATCACVVALVGLRAVRAGSLADACFGQVVWQVTALAMVRGFVSKQQNPLQPIESNVLAAPDGR